MINTYDGNYLINTDDGQYESTDLRNFERLEHEKDVSRGNICQTCINNYSCTTLLSFSRKSRTFVNVRLFSDKCNCYNK